MNIEKHLSLLEIIKKRPDSGQRDLAEAVGLSLGMTNILLKELAAKGWVMIRKINSRNFNYFLTPEGIKEVSKRSYRYLKKTIRNLADCRENVEFFVLETKKKGFSDIALVGKSEMDFVLEFICQKQGINFHACFDETGVPPGAYCLFSEAVPSQEPNLLALLPAGESREFSG